MNIIKTETFEFEGQTYEIRVMNTDRKYKVKVLLNNKPVNPYVYTVDFDTAFEYSHDHAETAYEHLMGIARSDVENRVWRPSR